MSTVVSAFADCMDKYKSEGRISIFEYYEYLLTGDNVKHRPYMIAHTPNLYVNKYACFHQICTISSSTPKALRLLHALSLQNILRSQTRGASLSTAAVAALQINACKMRRYARCAFIWSHVECKSPCRVSCCWLDVNSGVGKTHMHMLSQSVT